MTATFHVGDAITVMNRLPENSVDLILTSPPFLALRSYLPADHPLKPLEGGSQSTPGEYVDWLLDVVEACDRVLAPHGSLVFELGDTYAGSGGAGGDYAKDGLREGQPTFSQRSGRHRSGNESVERYRNLGAVDTGSPNGGSGWPLAKSLSLIPETFRFAMVYGTNPHTGRQTAPWRLRNVIRWVRPNPPVGALGDKFRPATSELMVFCKSAKRYFDLDAVRDPNCVSGVDYTKNAIKDPGRSDGWGRATLNRQPNPAGAPPLDWWNIPPGGYEGAHYAVWPPELCVKPIKAMCPEKVCRTCGEPSRRIVDYERTTTGNDTDYDIATGRTGGNARMKSSHGGTAVQIKRDTTGWSDCGHDDWRPGLVLDPFAGSGTTLAVATGHGRDAIGIDLDSRNFDLALERVGPFILERAS